MKNSAIIPTMQYKDATKALNWLCEAFGFEQHLIAEDEDGKVAHAQLTYNNSMVMIGPRRETDYGQYIRTPEEAGGVNTQSPYIIVKNIDKHYEQAKASGANIIIELREEDYGGKLYTCKDPEGFMWNFGSYDPWETN
ncbi:MAG: glyoxalase [Balneolaceae bacterium]|nr:glyoxalase [Balneolaceae bacterium]